MARYGKSDAKEIAALWRRSPDLELRIRLDSRAVARKPDEKPVRAEVFNPTRREMRLEKAVHALSSGALQLTTGNLEVDVQVADGPETGVRGLHQFIRQQFQAADADGKGVLSSKQAADAEVIAGLFVLADRDADGKLAEAELNAFLDLHALGAVSFTTLTLTDRRQGLFDLLDAEGDGRLSLQNLATGWDRLRVYDLNSEAAVTREQLPVRLQLRLVQGKPSTRQPNARSVVAKPSAARGPTWFRKMDRNGDGCVSRREWLGAEELFRRLDADSDGLLTPEEADAMNPETKND